jgi:GT2 family glycosyltransferase
VNEGGAGGFHEGIKRAHADGAEWLWLMDDDTIPNSGALTELLGAAGRLNGAAPPALLASRVVWRDGTLHPMNYPILERRRMKRVVEAAEHGLMPLRGAAFVSLLLHRRAVDRHRLPLKHLFLWADDIQYTSRIVLGGSPPTSSRRASCSTTPQRRRTFARQSPSGSTTTLATPC